MVIQIDLCDSLFLITIDYESRTVFESLKSTEFADFSCYLQTKIHNLGIS